jgi:hypothetical protein
VLTGGWQTSKETAYVQATRARKGTDWYLARGRPARCVPFGCARRSPARGSAGPEVSLVRAICSLH